MSSNGATARTRNRPGEGRRLRSDIVDAADALLAESGTSSRLSLRAVARAAGITAPAIYAHFATKDALLAAVVARRFEGLADALRSAEPGGSELSAGATAIERVRARAHAYVRYGAEHPGHYAVLFGPDADHAGLAFTGSPGEEVFAILLEPVTALAAARSEKRNPLELATDLWAALHGVVTLRASQTAFPWGDCDEQVNRVVDRLLAS